MNDESNPQKGETSPLDGSDLSSLLNNQTAIVSGGVNRVKRMTEEHQAADETSVTDSDSVALIVRGISESVRFTADRTEVVLGRSDLRSPLRPDMDLTYVGAAERGVSRRHARLELKDGHLYITDLNSSNGTFLRGIRLNPFTPTLLRSGDEVLLARLAVSISFE
jgi:pSer/pThr/pTyr-binding forkhead associated (FHA) protein